MDRNPLSDDLIFKILSYAPSKVAVTTSLLSKRWVSLWKHVPALRYQDASSESKESRALGFVERFLRLHKAPILETLELALSRHSRAIFFESWISDAVSRGVCNLRFSQLYWPCSYPSMWLPRSMFTCQTLVTLSIRQAVIVDVPMKICLGSLKVLVLALVSFPSGDEVIQRLLAGCPVLEDLKVIRYESDALKTFTIAVPSLERLAIMDSNYCNQIPPNDVGFVINVPSLKSLTVATRFTWVCSLVKMPKVMIASVALRSGDTKSLLACLTSAVKHLALCVKPPMDPNSIVVFTQLVSLRLCTCSSDWLRLILRHTPLLRELRFQLQYNPHPKHILNLQRRCSNCGPVQTQWEQPSSIPECLIWSLETVEWIGFKGTEAEKKVVMYLLQNSGQLRQC